MIINHNGTDWWVADNAHEAFETDKDYAIDEEGGLIHLYQVPLNQVVKEIDQFNRYA